MLNILAWGVGTVHCSVGVVDAVSVGRVLGSWVDGAWESDGVVLHVNDWESLVGAGLVEVTADVELTVDQWLRPDTWVLLLNQAGGGVDAVLAQGGLGDLGQGLSTLSIGSEGEAENTVDGEVHAEVGRDLGKNGGNTEGRVIGRSGVVHGSVASHGHVGHEWLGTALSARRPFIQCCRE